VPGEQVAPTDGGSDHSTEAEEYAGEPGVRGLTGVPLIEQMLGGEVIEQIEPPSQT